MRDFFQALFLLAVRLRYLYMTTLCLSCHRHCDKHLMRSASLCKLIQCTKCVILHPSPHRSLDQPSVLICSRCRRTSIFASIYRSTQFCMHGSSLRSSLPEEIFDVMHLGGPSILLFCPSYTPGHKYSLLEAHVRQAMDCLLDLRFLTWRDHQHR